MRQDGQKREHVFKFNLNPLTDTNMSSNFSEVDTSGSGIWGSGFLEAVEKLQELSDACCFGFRVIHIAVLKLKSSSQLAYAFGKSLHNTTNSEGVTSK